MGPTLLASKDPYTPYFGPNKNIPITDIVYKAVNTIAVLNLYSDAISDPTSIRTMATINGEIARSMEMFAPGGNSMKPKKVPLLAKAIYSNQCTGKLEIIPAVNAPGSTAPQRIQYVILFLILDISFII